LAALERGALSTFFTLAIESATVTPSVALLAGDEVVALRACAPEANAAEVILPAVASVMAEAGIAFSSLSLLAVAIGPGSFTGLRVGLASVKGLAFEGSPPVAAVPTLAALCFEGGSPRRPVAALLDARRGEVYAAAYGPGAAGAGEAELVAEGLYRPEILASQLPPDCAFVGDGAVLHGPALRAAGFVQAAEIVYAKAAPAVGRLGRRLFALGRAQRAADLAPRYLRRAEAEARRTGEALEREKPF
jgi:tRNA threonylcarbamoyladenosine biosynthesis protein TsaB